MPPHATPPANPHPVPTGERAARKHQAIVRAAREVFIREGFDAGMDRIAAEAEVSKVTVYNHFGSKENLFSAVIGEALDTALRETRGIIDAHLGDSDDVRTDLLRACRAWVAGLADPQIVALRALVTGELRRFPALGTTWYEQGPARLHAAIGAALGRLTERGRLTIDDTELAAIQLSRLVLSPHQIYGAYGKAPDAELAERLITGGVDMFLSYYRANA